MGPAAQAVGDRVEGVPGGQRPQGPALGGRGHGQRVEQRVDEAHVAEPDRHVVHAHQGEAVECDADHLRVGGGRVGAPDRFDTGLEELVRLVGGEAEDGPEIAVIGGARAGFGGMGEVVAADRNREFRAQAEFLARGVLGHEDAPADVLAREFEERLHRLEHRRRHEAVAGALDMLQQAQVVLRSLARGSPACLRSRHRLACRQSRGSSSNRPRAWRWLKCPAPGPSPATRAGPRSRSPACRDRCR